MVTCYIFGRRLCIRLRNWLRNDVLQERVLLTSWLRLVSSVKKKRMRPLEVLTHDSRATSVHQLLPTVLALYLFLHGGRKESPDCRSLLSRSHDTAKAETKHGWHRRSLQLLQSKQKQKIVSLRASQSCATNRHASSGSHDMKDRSQKSAIVRLICGSRVIDYFDKLKTQRLFDRLGVIERLTTIRYNRFSPIFYSSVVTLPSWNVLFCIFDVSTISDNYRETDQVERWAWAPSKF